MARFSDSDPAERRRTVNGAVRPGEIPRPTKPPQEIPPINSSIPVTIFSSTGAEQVIGRATISGTRLVMDLTPQDVELITAMATERLIRVHVIYEGAEQRR